MRLILYFVAAIYAFILIGFAAGVASGNVDGVEVKLFAILFSIITIRKAGRIHAFVIPGRAETSLFNLITCVRDSGYRFEILKSQVDSA